MLGRKKEKATIPRRGRRPKIGVAFKVRVFNTEGDNWVEERCWRCGRVLNKRRLLLVAPRKEQVVCPSCKAINKVEREE